MNNSQNKSNRFKNDTFTGVMRGGEYETLRDAWSNQYQVKHKFEKSGENESEAIGLLSKKQKKHLLHLFWNWESVVNLPFCENVRPEKISKGKYGLVLWMQQTSRSSYHKSFFLYKSDQILRKMNDFYGYALIRELRCV